MKFAVGITLYNFDYSQINRILEYLDSFDYVIVFDNTENNESNHKAFPSNIIYLTENRNAGLSYAFNSIVDYLKDKDCDYLCTIDQDSVFEKRYITKMKTFIEKFNIEAIGIAAPFIHYGYGSFNERESWNHKKWVITSGSFVNLHLFFTFNLRYDENYFIDKFEIDLCMQFMRNGIEPIMYYGSVLKQRLGEDSGHRHPNHSVLRHYYMFRNRIYFNRKWFGPIKSRFLTFFQTIKHFLLILMYENDKRRKIRVEPIARKDFRKNKMGKYEGRLL